MPFSKLYKKNPPSKRNEYIQVNMPYKSCLFHCRPQDKAFRVTNLLYVIFTGKVKPNKNHK